MISPAFLPHFLFSVQSERDQATVLMGSFYQLLLMHDDLIVSIVTSMHLLELQ